MANLNQNNSYNAEDINCNNNNNVNNDNINANTAEVRSLRDVNNFLQQPLKPVLKLQADSASYDHIVEMIRGLDLRDDGIVLNRKIKSIEIDFCNIVLNEDILCESMQYMNNKALADADTALKFAMLFSSHSFDALAMHDTKVRSTMLKILETNFINSQIYRSQDKNRLYNSITMLGEYYHRVRLADNKPVFILGESLLHLLNDELKEERPVDLRLAKLLLSQITLNGRLMRSRYQELLSQLFYHLRRQLIEQTTLTCTVKALLLMTLDMYYSNFDNLSKDLENMYTKYFLQGEQEVEADIKTPTTSVIASTNTFSFEETQKTNGLNLSGSEHNNSIEPNTPPTKKWSELIVEDSYENELGLMDDIDTWSNNIMDDNLSTGTNLNSDVATTTTTNTTAPEDTCVQSLNKASQSAYKTTSPRKSQHIQSQQTKQVDEDDDKPLPRWRAPRFKREGNENRPNHYHQQQHHSAGGGHHNHRRSGGRRISGSFDDDGQSVRSEGGSIRLYSINDRLKHSQERIDRINPSIGGGNNNYYNSSSIANSNWDRQSNNFDDRSERSYISNYERGHQQQQRRNGGGSRHFNNHNNNSKQMYDKPPRFQKQQQQQQQHQKHTTGGEATTWRKNWQHENSSPPPSIDNFSVTNGEPDANGRNSSRACTLPRPHKKPLELGGEQPHVLTATFQRRRSSQSPSGRGQFAANRRQHNYRNYHQNNNNDNHHRHQYGSHNSLASDASGGGFMDRRQHQHHHHQRRSRQFNNNSNTHNHNFNNNNKNNHNNGLDVKDKNGNENSDNPPSRNDIDGELVRNARETSNYMNYLSQKK